jgi:flagellin-like hook-associated protein FlgL
MPADLRSTIKAIAKKREVMDEIERKKDEIVLLQTLNSENLSKYYEASKGLEEDSVMRVAEYKKYAENAKDGREFMDHVIRALSEVSRVVNTAYSLAQEAVGGTLSDDQRETLNVKFDACKAQLTFIGEHYKYNGNVLMNDGTLETPNDEVKFQVGTGSEARITYTLFGVNQIDFSGNISTQSDAGDVLILFEGDGGFIDVIKTGVADASSKFMQLELLYTTLKSQTEEAQRALNEYKTQRLGELAQSVSEMEGQIEILEVFQK